jgi:hypothetical protein
VTQRAPDNQPPQQSQPPIPPIPPTPPGPQPPTPSSPYDPYGGHWPSAPQVPAPNPYGAPGGGYGAYGGTPSPYQPRKSGSGKTIAIIVGVIVLVVLLFCGGFVALIVWAANNAEDAINEYDTDRRGGRDNPITVAEGESFEIDGVEYAEGWRIQPPTEEHDTAVRIVDLKAENDRDDESSEYVSLTFTFVGADDVEVGQISCSSDGQISHGRTEVLDCAGYDVGLDYDHIEVSAL